MSETYVSHTKPWSRMQSLSESRGGSKVAKPIFSNSIKRYCNENCICQFRGRGVGMRLGGAGGTEIVPSVVSSSNGIGNGEDPCQSGFMNWVSNVIRVCFGFALHRSVIGWDNSRHFFSNERHNQNQWWVARAHFPAFGSLRCLRLLWFVREIALVWVLRH